MSWIRRFSHKLGGSFQRVRVQHHASPLIRNAPFKALTYCFRSLTDSSTPTTVSSNGSSSYPSGNASQLQEEKSNRLRSGAGPENNINSSRKDLKEMSNATPTQKQPQSSSLNQFSSAIREALKNVLRFTELDVNDTPLWKRNGEQQKLWKALSILLGIFIDHPLPTPSSSASFLHPLLCIEMLKLFGNSRWIACSSDENNSLSFVQPEGALGSFFTHLNLLEGSIGDASHLRMEEETNRRSTGPSFRQRKSTDTEMGWATSSVFELLLRNIKEKSEQKKKIEIPQEKKIESVYERQKVLHEKAVHVALHVLIPLLRTPTSRKRRGCLLGVAQESVATCHAESSSISGLSFNSEDVSSSADPCSSAAPSVRANTSKPLYILTEPPHPQLHPVLETAFEWLWALDEHLKHSETPSAPCFARSQWLPLYLCHFDSRLSHFAAAKLPGTHYPPLHHVVPLLIREEILPSVDYCEALVKKLANPANDSGSGASPEALSGQMNMLRNRTEALKAQLLKLLGEWWRHEKLVLGQRTSFESSVASLEALRIKNQCPTIFLQRIGDGLFWPAPSYASECVSSEEAQKETRDLSGWNPFTEKHHEETHFFSHLKGRGSHDSTGWRPLLFHPAVRASLLSVWSSEKSSAPALSEGKNKEYIVSTTKPNASLLLPISVKSEGAWRQCLLQLVSCPSLPQPDNFVSSRKENDSQTIIALYPVVMLRSSPADSTQGRASPLEPSTCMAAEEAAYLDRHLLLIMPLYRFFQALSEVSKLQEVEKNISVVSTSVVGAGVRLSPLALADMTRFMLVPLKRRYDASLQISPVVYSCSSLNGKLGKLGKDDHDTIIYPQEAFALLPHAPRVYALRDVLDLLHFTFRRASSSEHTMQQSPAPAAGQPKLQHCPHVYEYLDIPCCCALAQWSQVVWESRGVARRLVRALMEEKRCSIEQDAFLSSSALSKDGGETVAGGPRSYRSVLEAGGAMNGGAVQPSSEGASLIHLLRNSAYRLVEPSLARCYSLRDQWETRLCKSYSTRNTAAITSIAAAYLEARNSLCSLVGVCSEDEALPITCRKKGERKASPSSSAVWRSISALLASPLRDPVLKVLEGVRLTGIVLNVAEYIAFEEIYQNHLETAANASLCIYYRCHAMYRNTSFSHKESSVVEDFSTNELDEATAVKAILLVVLAHRDYLIHWVYQLSAKGNAPMAAKRDKAAEMLLLPSFQSLLQILEYPQNACISSVLPMWNAVGLSLNFEEDVVRSEVEETANGTLVAENAVSMTEDPIERFTDSLAFPSPVDLNRLRLFSSHSFSSVSQKPGIDKSWEKLSLKGAFGAPFRVNSSFSTSSDFVNSFYSLSYDDDGLEVTKVLFPSSANRVEPLQCYWLGTPTAIKVAADMCQKEMDYRQQHTTLEVDRPLMFALPWSTLADSLSTLRLYDESGASFQRREALEVSLQKLLSFSLSKERDPQRLDESFKSHKKPVLIRFVSVQEEFLYVIPVGPWKPMSPSEASHELSFLSPDTPMYSLQLSSLFQFLSLGFPTNEERRATLSSYSF